MINKKFNYKCPLCNSAVLEKTSYDSDPHISIYDCYLCKSYILDLLHNSGQFVVYAFLKFHYCNRILNTIQYKWIDHLDVSVFFEEDTISISPSNFHFCDINKDMRTKIPDFNSLPELIECVKVLSLFS